MDDPCFIQYRERIQDLSCKDTDKVGRKAAELVLLDKFIQVHRHELEDETEMFPMDKVILQS